MLASDAGMSEASSGNLDLFNPDEGIDAPTYAINLENGITSKWVRLGANGIDLNRQRLCDNTGASGLTSFTIDSSMPR